MSTSGKVVGKKLPPEENDSDLCVPGKVLLNLQMFAASLQPYQAFLTFNVFEESGDSPPYCDEKFHPNDTPVVALSTGWYDNASRCLKHINVTANGHSVLALVNVTQLWVAIKIMIMNLLMLTTLCLPQLVLYGKPQVCLMINGVV